MAFSKFFLCILMLMLLPGCVDTSQSVSGEILEYHSAENDTLTALVIETEDGEEKVFERAGLALIRLAIHF